MYPNQNNISHDHVQQLFIGTQILKIYQRLPEKNCTRSADFSQMCWPTKLIFILKLFHSIDDHHYQQQQLLMTTSAKIKDETF